MMTANTGSFEKVVLQSAVPVLVDFYATWCGPCKMLTPVLEDLAKSYEGRAAIVKVDVDESQDLATQYGISAVPALLVFQNGQVMNQTVGFQSRKDLAAMLDKAMQATVVKAG